MPISPDTLLDEAKCLGCNSGASLAEMLKLALLQRIAEGGGGGGGSAYVISGVGAPVADPGVTAAIYFDTATGVQYNWYSGAWH